MSKRSKGEAVRRGMTEGRSVSYTEGISDAVGYSGTPDTSWCAPTTDAHQFITVLTSRKTRNIAEFRQRLRVAVKNLTVPEFIELRNCCVELLGELLDEQELGRL
jgi:hypothetical protein